MPGLKDRVQARLAQLRADMPWVDHVLRMQERYSAVGASQQAGAVTYFGFLSVFPVLALAFFVVGWVSRVYPDAQQNLKDATNAVLPGLVGAGDSGEVSMSQVQNAANAVGIVGLLGVLYAGLGWLGSLRRALIDVFDVPTYDQPYFLVGKLRDLATLVVLGVILLVAVAVAGFVGGFSADVLAWCGISSGFCWLLTLISVAFGLAANTVLFFAMFRLLASPRTGQRDLWAGAFLGGVGFEILKQLSGLLLSSSRGSPAFQVFGISLILLVWINYFSRVTLYAAAYAYTAHPDPRPEHAPVQGPQSPPVALPERARGKPLWAFLAGAGSAVIGIAAVRARRR